MRTWGQALILICFLAIAGAMTEESAQKRTAVLLESAPGIVVLGGLGAWLWSDGQKRLNALQRSADEALRLNREDGHINAHKLSGILQIPETEVRAKVSKAQKKSWIPYGVDVK